MAPLTFISSLSISVCPIPTSWLNKSDTSTKTSPVKSQHRSCISASHQATAHGMKNGIEESRVRMYCTSEAGAKTDNRYEHNPTSSSRET
ncbi:hypothetical protein IE53DRAFT_134118 [Violaceomyces palustris]|uniref:Uncharacterized protein n=1 Tax=Violaceomyces palustris TaxID=1673888 RepID=A0ACD0P6F1_9BASI|nr:hypothetical protein IE53DRAFT_134118 [Violaceomyces palustris]